MKNIVGKVIAFVVAAIFALLILILPFCISNELYQAGRVYVWLVAFPTLAFFYVATMTYLNSKMKQLKVKSM